MRDISLPQASTVSRPSLDRRLVARLLLGALLLGSAPACMTWRVGPMPEPATAAPRRLELARVTADGGDVMVLSRVTVTQDSVHGWRRAAGRPVEVALARSEVRIFEVQRYHAVGTGSVVVVLLAAVLSYLSDNLWA